MRFAVEYSQYTAEKFNVTDTLLEKVDEITIWWNPKDLTLFEFLIKYANKRINIIIADNDTFIQYKLASKIKGFIKEHSELDIAFAFTYNIINEHPDTFKELQELQLKYYYQFPIDNWEEFNFWIQSGASDINIGNQLCFELEKCKNMSKEYNVKLRTDIGVVQKKFKTTNDYQSFFIRPEDIDYYSQYIDVYNLYWYYEDKRDLKVLYDIYAIDKYWYGNLQEIISDLSELINSKCLLATFAENRTNCGRKCLSGSNCRICKNMFELAKILNENSLMLEDDK